MSDGFRHPSWCRSRLVCCGALAAAAFFFAGVASAETTFFPTPSGNEDYLTVARDNKVETSTRYVNETDQDWFSDAPRSQSTIDPVDALAGINGASVAIVVLLIVLFIFLFLKFGGAAGLLSSDPTNASKPRRKVKAWGLSSDDSDGVDILAQVRAMTDRRAALILLLRHCLLRAASETQTNFRRADTERDALGRLPGNWRNFLDLKQLMHRSELVHYGGRKISDESYERALSEGENILGGAR